MKHLSQSMIDWSVRQPHVNRRKKNLQEALQRTPMEDPSWKYLREALTQVGASKTYSGEPSKPWGIDGHVSESVQELPEDLQAWSHAALRSFGKRQGLEWSSSMTKAQMIAVLKDLKKETTP